MRLGSRQQLSNEDRAAEQERRRRQAAEDRRGMLIALRYEDENEDVFDELAPGQIPFS